MDRLSRHLEALSAGRLLASLELNRRLFGIACTSC